MCKVDKDGHVWTSRRSASQSRCEWALCGRATMRMGIYIHQKPIQGPHQSYLAWGGAGHQGKVGPWADTNTGLVMSYITFLSSQLVSRTIN